MASIPKLKKQILTEDWRHRQRNKTGRFLLFSFCLLLLAGAAGFGWFRAHPEFLLDWQFKRAENHFYEKEYSKAAAAFRTLQQTHPTYSLAAESLLRAGELSQFYLENHQRALLDYLLVIRDYPQGAAAMEALQRAAGIYMDQLKNYPQAIVTYQKLLDREVADRDRVQYRIGEAYFRLNNFEQARIEWETLLNQFPDTSLAPETYYRIAVTWSMQGNSDRAKDTFQQIFTKWPRHPFALEARFGFARELEEQDHLREALNILLDIEKSYPDTEVINQRIEQIRKRIAQKKKAI